MCTESIKVISYQRFCFSKNTFKLLENNEIQLFSSKTRAIRCAFQRLFCRLPPSIKYQNVIVGCHHHGLWRDIVKPSDAPLKIILERGKV